MKKIELSFNTVFYIMLYLANQKGKLTQSKLFSEYIACIDPDNLTLTYYKESDCSKISKVMAKSRELSFVLDMTSRINNIDNSSNIFTEHISHYFNTADKILLTLILLNLMEEESTTSKKDNMFYEIFKMPRSDFFKQDQFIFSDLMIRIFIYITSEAFKTEHYKAYDKNLHAQISTKGGNQGLMDDSNIVSKYIENFRNFIDINDYDFNEETQMVIFKNPKKIFVKERNTTAISQSEITINEIYKVCECCKYYEKISNKISSEGNCLYHLNKVNSDDTCKEFKIDYGKATVFMLSKNKIQE